MALLDIAPAAFKQGKIVSSTGFLKCKQSNYESKTSKDGLSTNHWLSFQVVEAGEYEGLNIPWCVNEKGLDPSMGAPGMKLVREYLGANGINVDENTGLKLDFGAANGNIFYVYVQPGKSNKGQNINEVAGFKPND